MVDLTEINWFEPRLRHEKPNAFHSSLPYCRAVVVLLLSAPMICRWSFGSDRLWGTKRNALSFVVLLLSALVMICQWQIQTKPVGRNRLSRALWNRFRGHQRYFSLKQVTKAQLLQRKLIRTQSFFVPSVPKRSLGLQLFARESVLVPCGIGCEQCGSFCVFSA